MAARKRVTEKQLAANRANAIKSAGPRTPEGKAKSRWNAMRHGILAQAVIPPALEAVECRTAFDDLLASLRAECAPATVAEGALVEMIAVTYWRLGRLLRTEAAAMVAANRPPRNDSPEDAQALSRLQASADRLTTALDDPAALRKIMDPTGVYANLSDYRMRDLALQRVLDLQDEVNHARARAATPEPHPVDGGLPATDAVISFARYQAQLQRQILRALVALERLQHLRAAAQEEPAGPAQGTPTAANGSRPVPASPQAAQAPFSEVTD